MTKQQLNQKALKDLEDALAALKKRVYKSNPKLFEAMSKAYQRLKQERVNVKDTKVYVPKNKAYNHQCVLFLDGKFKHDYSC